MIAFFVFFLLTAILLTLIKVVIGPTAIDRALALETLLVILMIGIGFYLIAFDGEAYLLDWLLVWSLTPFIASQILAKTLLAERRTE